MNLHEYQAKKLFADYGLPVSEGYAVDTADEAVEAAEKIGGTRWEMLGKLSRHVRELSGKFLGNVQPRQHSH